MNSDKINLWSMEELDPIADDANLAEDVVEATEVTEEVVEDAAEISEFETAIDEVVGEDGAAEKLEEVKEVMEASLDEDGDGLDEVASESLRIAVESICHAIQYDSKSIYPLYSKENFESKSSRRANTQIALEAVSDTLKTFYERSKKAIKELWEKVKAFFAKHFTQVGILRKAIKTAEDKVKDLKGDVEFGETKAPKSLKSAFPQKDKKISASLIGEYMSEAIGASDAVAKEAEKMTKAATAGELTLDKAYADGDLIIFGDDDEPLPGGRSYTLMPNTENGKFSLGKTSAVTNRYDLKAEVTLDDAKSSEIKALLKQATEALNKTEVLNKSVKTISKAFEKGELRGNTEESMAKAIIASQSAIAKGMGPMYTTMAACNVIGVKGVILYAHMAVRASKA